MYFWPFSKKTPEEPKPEDTAIHQFVNKLLEDVRLNNSMIPDAIERKMYFELFETLLEILKKVADTTVIEFLNHRITIKIEPMVDRETHEKTE